MKKDLITGVSRADLNEKVKAHIFRNRIERFELNTAQFDGFYLATVAYEPKIAYNQLDGLKLVSDMIADIIG